MIGRRAIRVTGRVQGVAFRAGAQREARRLGLAGSAQNEPDGSVAIEVEGEKAALEAFVAWCGVGPAAARVEGIDVRDTGMPLGEKGFSIRRSGRRGLG